MSLVAKLDEMKHLAKVLVLWEHISLQGIDPDSVAAFIFDPSLASTADKKAIGHIRTKVFNAVRLHDGTVRKLRLMLGRV